MMMKPSIRLETPAADGGLGTLALVTAGRLEITDAFITVFRILDWAVEGGRLTLTLQS